MNREGIRRLAAEELGLPTSALSPSPRALDELAAAADEHRLPLLRQAGDVVVGQGPDRSSRRRPTCERPGTTRRRAAASSQGQVIVEGLIDFDYEITLLTVRALGADGAVETHFCEPIGHVQVKGDYVESWQPQPMSAGRAANARAQIAAP